MGHLAECDRSLKLLEVCVRSRAELLKRTRGFDDVCVVRLPPCPTLDGFGRPLAEIGLLVAEVAENISQGATLVTIGEVQDLVQVQLSMPTFMRCQHWIAVKRLVPKSVSECSLAHQHFGVLIHTKYHSSLRHAKTRVAYTYCPVCKKTTKDYGGKKHIYHEYGTLLSDVWRDVECELEGDLTDALARLADLFGIEPYRTMQVLDCREMRMTRQRRQSGIKNVLDAEFPAEMTNKILCDDCLDALSRIPDNSVDFAFTDPPYNLGKKYVGYSDDLSVIEYFEWCDRWIAEITRVLKTGRTLAVLNIPIWAVRHFQFMQTVLRFQNWVVWEALAFPVRLIMPAHYAVLCFTKGQPRPLPGLVDDTGDIRRKASPRSFEALKPLAEGYCTRPKCVAWRKRRAISDRVGLGDLWWDIHRLKHNSRRVDHPCQLPPHLMERIISVFTKPNELVLDCFNGAGTTTLVAHELGRRYLGIEATEQYCRLAESRHKEVERGQDPFRKADRVLTAKNSPVPRMPKQEYRVSKKELQLEVKRIAGKLGRLPTRDEVCSQAKYPIEYYDSYFVSWGEVCAAARTTGMTDTRSPVRDPRSTNVTQYRLNLGRQK